ncbi:MAG: glycosyltransferase family 4 protein [bacterium]
MHIVIAAAFGTPVLEHLLDGDTHSPPRVFFHGLIPHNQVMSELAVTDLLAHPAVVESFGMTIAEAMALGIPVVAGRISGAIPWVLGEGSEEMLVDVGAANAIADTAVALLKDSVKYRHYSKQGRVRASELFSADAVSKAYTVQYQKILNAQPVERLFGELQR